MTAVAALVPAAAEARAQKTLVIKVTSVSVALKTNDRPPKGASKGDTVLFRDNLVNAVAQFGKPSGVKVGTDRGTMTFTAKDAAAFKGIAVLPGGTLTLDGPVVSVAGGNLVIPVTAGTGRYKGATGTVLVGPGNKRSLNTYTLNVPTGIAA
jgi:hypothetical protein